MNLLNPKKIVGIEIHGNGIWAAEVCRSGRGCGSERLHHVEAESEQTEAIVQALSSLVEENGLQGSAVSMVVNDTRILHRAFVFPRMSLKELKSIVPMEAWKEFGVREGFEIAYEINSQFKEEGLPRVEVLAAAVPGDLVKKAVRIIEESGLVPCYLTTIPLAERFAPSNALVIEDEITSARLHATRKGIHLSVFHGERFLFSRMLKKDLEFLDLNREPEGLSAEGPGPDREPEGLGKEFTTTAEDTEGLSENPLERLSMEVQRSFLYVKQQSRVPVTRVWLTGEGASLTALRDKLEKDLELPVQTPGTVPAFNAERFSGWSKDAGSLYDLCLGTALFSAVDSPGNLVPPIHLQKRKSRFYQQAAKFGLIGTAVLILALYVHLEWSLKLAGDAFAQLQNRMEGVSLEYDERSTEIRSVSEKLIESALVQGFSSRTESFEDILVVLGLETPDQIVLDELSISGGGKPFSMKITGTVSLPRLSGGDEILDRYLNQLEGTGQFRSVRGHLGSGSENGESGQMKMVDGGAHKRMVFSVVAN